MSITASDWDTISMKLENSIFDTSTRSDGRLKQPSLSTAIDLNDYAIVKFLAKTKGGLINSGFRKKVWPLLLGIDDDRIAELETIELSTDWNSKELHKDEDQVSLDVDRSFIHYPHSCSNRGKEDLKTKLKNIIVRMLREHPRLSYYQGYHEICSVFVMIFQDETELCFQCVENFTLLYLRDFMMPSINESVKILRLVPKLIEKIDRTFYNSLLLNDIEPYFCLSPVITLFSHNITSLDAISQIFDGILSNGSLNILLYYFVAFLLERKESIFEQITILEKEKCFTKHDVIHDVLSKFLQNIDKEGVEEGLQISIALSKKTPLNMLKPFHDIQENSVLKTSPLTDDIDQLVIKERLDYITDKVLVDQINESKTPTISSSNNSKFSIKDVLRNRQNQNLFKLSLTIGIISLLLNIILKKNDTFQLQTHITYLWNTHKEAVNIGIRPFRDLIPRFF